MTRLARWWASVVEVVEFRHARAVHRLPRSPDEQDLTAERHARKAYRDRMGLNKSREERLADNRRFAPVGVHRLPQNTARTSQDGTQERRRVTPGSPGGSDPSEGHTGPCLPSFGEACGSCHRCTDPQPHGADR